MSVASAYASDVSTPENRAKSFGKIGAAFGIGFICGPVLGGLLGEISLTLPF
jgi:DHA1 family tetracycline resistance protein-like MFS transporter